MQRQQPANPPRTTPAKTPTPPLARDLLRSAQPRARHVSAMNDIGITQVLAQIRAINTAASPKPAAAPANGAALENFSATLGKALDGVASAQNTAADLSTRFELGDKSVDLAQVMVAGARSQVNFRAAVEVRNRLVSAYQDVMNMPI